MGIIDLVRKWYCSNATLPSDQNLLLRPHTKKLIIKQMQRFLIPILIIITLKVYVYGSLIRLFERPLYRRLAVLLSLISIIPIGTTYLAFQLHFSNGIIAPPLWANLSIGLMISFLVCELILAGFFVLDDTVGISKKSVHWYKNRDVKAALSLSRRKLIKQTGLILTLLPFSSFIYGITKGKYNFWVNNKPVVFEDLPAAFDGFRIAHISDIHAGSFDNVEAVKKGIQMIQDQKPDLILFTGDLVNSHAKEIEPYLESFKALSAPYGKFSVLGNHDYPGSRRRYGDENFAKANFAQIKEHHKTMGFDLMLNQNRKITKSNEYFRLLGVENWGRSNHFPKLGDLDKTLEGCSDKEFNILLSHDPTHWEDKVLDHPTKFHLTLSGHTHGMQMGIDLPQFKWSPVKYVYKHWAGLYNEKNQNLYVNRGFGFLAFAGRVGVFPEITILELKKG